VIGYRSFNLLQDDYIEISPGGQKITVKYFDKNKEVKEPKIMNREEFDQYIIDREQQTEATD
jgi:hypothetical protein